MSRASPLARVVQERAKSNKKSSRRSSIVYEAMVAEGDTRGSEKRGLVLGISTIEAVTYVQ